jgi:hypothetical protein
VRVLRRDVRGQGDDAVLLGSVPSARVARPVFDQGGGMSDDGIQRRGDRPKPGEPGYVDTRSESGRRGYKWPAFTKGNEMAATHRATVDRVVNPIADELVEGLLERRPDLAAYPEALAAWSRAESRCLLLESHIVSNGLIDENGKATVGEGLLGQSERLAAQLRSELGLTPKSEAELANAQADAAQSVVDLDALRARGREALKVGRLAGRREQLTEGDGQ